MGRLSGRFLLCAVSVLLACLGGSADAVPTQMNYQGKLTGTGGQPVADGSYGMRFYLYSAASGGTLLWQEPAAGQPAMAVQVTGGVFSALLGTIVALPGSAFQGTSYIQTEVNGVLMTPRAQLVSSPYAMRAGTVDLPLALSGEVYSSIFPQGRLAAVVAGYNTATNGGQFTIPGVGVLGTSGAGNYGYLGGSYGAYGANAGSGDYGYLGGPDGGAYGRDQSTSSYGYLGFAGWGVYGHSGSSVGSQAGYFSGDVTVSGSLNVSGSLSLPSVNYIAPDAMGIIRGLDGAKVNGVGFISSTYDSTLKLYQIEYPGYTVTSHLTVVTPIGFDNCTAVAAATSDGYLSITIYDSAGNKIKSSFSFVTYRLQ